MALALVRISKRLPSSQLPLSGRTVIGLDPRFLAIQWRLPDKQRKASVEARAGSRILFILAGMPGSGKTRLLHQALAKGWPIFGKADHGVFLATRPPSVYPEERMSMKARLAAGTWISETHIARLSPSALPSPLVVHLDLFWFLQLLRLAANPPASLAPSAFFCVDALGDAARVEAAYLALLSTPFFRQWDRVVVNTLRPPYARTVGQWSGRESTVHRSEGFKSSPVVRLLRDDVYDRSKCGQQVYDALYTGWQQAVVVLRPAVALLTEGDGTDALTIRTIAGDKR